MWSIPGKSVPVERFAPFEPGEVLYEFDSPRIFTVCDLEGELNLAYWSDEDAAICRYVVVPTTDKSLQSLRRGEISVYEALNQPRCWLCDLTHQGEFVACQRVDFESIPKDSLPARLGRGSSLLPNPNRWTSKLGFGNWTSTASSVIAGRGTRGTPSLTRGTPSLKATLASKL